MYMYSICKCSTIVITKNNIIHQHHKLSSVHVGIETRDILPGSLTKRIGNWSLIHKASTVSEQTD